MNEQLSAEDAAIPRVHRFLIAAAVLTAAFLAFMPILPGYLYHWDEYQLSLAQAGFSVVQHHPHPPGYYLFVLLERLFALAAPDGIEPGRLTAVFATAAAAACLVFVLPARNARSLILPSLVFPVLAFTSPVIAFYSVAVLTYTSEAWLWLLILLMLMRHPKGWRLWLFAAFVGAAAGVRQTLLLWALPVAAFELYRCRERIRIKDLAAAGLCALLGAAAWLIPMLYETGGVQAYLQAAAMMRETMGWHRSVLEAPLQVLVERWLYMLRWLFQGLAIGAVLPLAAFLLRLGGAKERLRKYDVLLLAALVPFVFYALIIFDNIGYIVPVLFLLLAYGVLGLAAAGPRSAFALLASVTLLSILPVIKPFWAAGTWKSTLSAYEKNDQVLEARFARIRERFAPQETVLLTGRQYWVRSFRTLMYYLPEYTTLQLMPDNVFPVTSEEKLYLAARGHSVWAAGPEGFMLRELLPVPDRFVHALYVFPEDSEEFLDSACSDFTHDIYVGRGSKPMLVIRPGHSSQLTVKDGRLLCSDSLDLPSFD